MTTLLAAERTFERADAARLRRLGSRPRPKRHPL